ncbi:MAG: hypothetical protein WA816_00910 [Bacteroidales bacterium]
MFALLAWESHFVAFSQSDTLPQSGRNIYDKNDSIYHIHSLYSSIGSGSNMIFLGSTISQDKPFYSAALTYGYKNSFYTSASVSHIIGENPYLAFYSLSLNYNHVFNSWFDISSSIVGYKTPQSLQEKLFSDFAFINLTTGFDWKLIYTKLSFGEIFSDNRRGYFQVRNSRYFETPVFFKGKGQISFDPNFNTLFGDLVKIETTTGPTKLGSASPFHRFRKIPNSTIISYSYKFGLIDFEFSLPVTFSYGNFSIEAEPSYILPSFSNSDYPAPEGFTLFVNAFFRIL